MDGRLQPSAADREPGWPRQRWLGLVGLVLAGQLGLIFWLGSRGPLPPRPPVRGPELVLAGAEASNLFALANPTLFALPGPRGFAGAAWLAAPTQEFHPFTWSEPPRLLEFTAEQLGTALACVSPSNGLDRPLLPGPPEPALTTASAVMPPVTTASSSLEIKGPLSRRKLLTHVELPTWTNDDLLTNTVLQLAVRADGRPLSVEPVSSSGLPAADEYAYVQARRARFEPLPDSVKPAGASNELTWGALVFAWQTAPGTNAPAPQ